MQGGVRFPSSPPTAGRHTRRPGSRRRPPPPADPELHEGLRGALLDEQELHLEDGSFVELVAFPDFEAAMRNSEHSVIADFAKRMQEVTEGEVSFRNPDVRETMRL